MWSVWTEAGTHGLRGSVARPATAALELAIATAAVRRPTSGVTSARVKRSRWASATTSSVASLTRTWWTGCATRCARPNRDGDTLRRRRACD